MKRTKANVLRFFDAQSRATYTLIGDALHCESENQDKVPKVSHINALPLSSFTHIRIEVAKNQAHSADMTHLLFHLASMQGDITKPIYAYELYYFQREHLFDEQKYTYECFFYDKYANTLNMPSAKLITCDIFLPSALYAMDIDTNTKAHLLVWIESCLCYFQNTFLKEVFTCKATAQEQLLYQINSHIAYLQETYHQRFTHLYYLSEDGFIENLQHLATYSTSTYSAHIAHLAADSEATNQAHNHLHIAPLCALYTRYTFSSATFKAFLAFQYMKLYEREALSLPNFAPKPLANKRFYLAMSAVAMLLLCVIPLLLAAYNHHLKTSISQLNADNERLFSAQFINDDDDSALQDRLKALTRTEQMIINNIQDLILWQQSYHQRYQFIQEIFTTYVANVVYESISFHFTPQTFIATVKVSAPSQVPIASLLATFNANNQSAFLQDSIVETFANNTEQMPIESAEIESNEKPNESPAHFYADIVVIQNVI